MTEKNTPAPESIDYEAASHWLAGHAQGLKDAAQITARKPMSESDIMKCLTRVNCLGTVLMTFGSGPYEIERSSVVCEALIRAVEAHHSIGIKEKSE